VVARLAAFSAGAGGTGTVSVNSFAPHMPQKRFASEFSLPQRAQRNRSLLISIDSLRYLAGSLQDES
jgi:methylmalonyl-CoA mutase N-terminal domain/subunit